jgi:DNA-binding NtrC family response regulator
LATALCPDPEVFAGQSKAGVIQFRRADGNDSVRGAQFMSLGEAPLGASTVLVVVGSEELPAAAQDPLPQETEAEWLHRRLRQVRQQIQPHCPLELLLGESVQIRRARVQVESAMATRGAVMVVAPPGGRGEQLARAIYYRQHRDDTPGPLVPLSCTLLDAELLQSTIRDMKRPSGDWELERPAALLLLDVDALSSDAQTELLGFLTIPSFELQLISTSQTSPYELMRSSSYSADLANLLSPVVVELPPLATRPQDVPLLAQWLLEQQSSKRNRQLSGFSPEALDRLAAYSWPNEVEELEQVMVEVTGRADGPLVKAGDLPVHLTWERKLDDQQRGQREQLPLDQALLEVETELIRRTLNKCKGNKAEAARRLGISRPRLLRRIELLGIE